MPQSIYKILKIGFFVLALSFVGVSTGWGDDFEVEYGIATQLEPEGSNNTYENYVAPGESGRLPSDAEENPQASTSPQISTSSEELPDGCSYGIKNNEVICPESSSSTPKYKGGESELEKYTRLNQCDSNVEEAFRCCNNPMSCVGGNSAATQAVTALAAEASTIYQLINSSKGTADSCKASKNLAALSGATSATLRSMCVAKKNKCISSCSGSTDSDHVKGVKACETLSLNVTAMTYELAQSYSGYKFAQACQEAVERDGGGDDNNQLEFADTYTDPNPNCADPANAANPFCQERCNKPGAENDPACGPISGGGTGGASFTASSAADFGDGGDLNADGLDLGEDDQSSIFDEASEPRANEVAATGGAGGGGMGGGIGGAASPDEGGGGGDPGSGLKTDIHQGEKGGGGGGGYVSGGGGGNGNGNGNGNRYGRKLANGKAFNLKKFLPRDKNGQRTLANINGRKKGNAREIASKYTSIWQRITRRYGSICYTGVLYQCLEGKR